MAAYGCPSSEGNLRDARGRAGQREAGNRVPGNTLSLETPRLTEIPTAPAAECRVGPSWKLVAGFARKEVQWDS